MRNGPLLKFRVLAGWTTVEFRGEIDGSPKESSIRIGIVLTAVRKTGFVTA